VSRANGMVNAIIIDDEPLAIAAINALCQNFPEINILEKCNNAMEAFQALHKHQIDLIFLDINMPIIDGLSFLRSLKDPPAVILTTAYTEYALEGYELDVVDYLIKPISLDRFAKAIQKYKNRKGAGNSPAADHFVPLTPTPTFNTNTNAKDFMFIKENGKLIKLNYKDIYFIEGMKDYLKIMTKDKFHLVHQTMKSMEEQLPANLFARVHKSYIVAIAAIKQIDGNCIETERGGVPLSTTYKEELLALMNI
jgi:DNA-binding LytR/AlgR family response regulator